MDRETPKYYKGYRYNYEASKVCEDFELSYNLGNAVSYLLRAGKKVYVDNCPTKSAIEDIEKTIHHLQFELERLRYKLNN